MVMGPTHAMSGAAVWLSASAGGLIPVVAGAPLPVVFAGAAVCSGAALLPDLDCPGSLSSKDGSTVVRAFGFAGEAIGHTLENVSQAVYNLTRSKKDEARNSGHRTLTHTLLFAIALSFGVGALASITSTFTVRGHEFSVGQVSTLVVMWAMLHLAMFGLAEKWVKKNRKKYGLLFLVVCSGALTAFTVSQLPPGGYPWLGFAVGAGSLIHCFGDAITKAGVPLLWPLPIAGRRWFELSTGPLAIRAGGGFEYAVLLPLFTTVAVVSAVLVVPEARDVVNDIVNTVREHQA
jgi:membrane-bound metal-dependent hydrolase YbcI (DUF457 family)